MKRRTLLISIGGAAGTAGVIGTGAFTSVEADRDVSVSVANENDAYLGIEPSPSGSPNSEFATQDSSNADQIALEFDDSGNSGSGVGLSSVYDFDDVFRVTNQGTQTVYVWANFSSGDLSDDEIWFYPDGESSRELNDEENSVVTVPVGETIKMGVHIDTNVLGSTENEALTATLTADVDVPSGSDPSDGVGEDAAVVSKDPDQGEYSSIQTAIDNVDGTTVFVESGTYSENIVVDKAGLTLQSTDGPEGTVIDGSVKIDSAASTGSIVSDVTVEGFRIEPSSDPAIEAETGSSGDTKDGLTIRNNELVARNDGVGAFLGQIKDATIEDNHFTTASGATPIELLFVGGERSYGSGRTSENVTVQNNVFEGEADRDQISGGNAIEFEATGSITNNDFSSFESVRSQEYAPNRGVKILLGPSSDLGYEDIVDNNQGVTGLGALDLKTFPDPNQVSDDPWLTTVQTDVGGIFWNQPSTGDGDNEYAMKPGDRMSDLLEESAPQDGEPIGQPLYVNVSGNTIDVKSTENDGSTTTTFSLDPFDGANFGPVPDWARILTGNGTPHPSNGIPEETDYVLSSIEDTSDDTEVSYDILVEWEEVESPE